MARVEYRTGVVRSMSEFYKMLSSSGFSSSDAYMESLKAKALASMDHAAPLNSKTEIGGNRQGDSKLQILRWLMQSSLAAADAGDDPSKRRYVIPQSEQVRLNDGNAYFVQEWLHANGVYDGTVINGYRVDLMSSAEHMVIEDVLLHAPFDPPQAAHGTSTEVPVDGESTDPVSSESPW
jgi:hypothetical protein